MAHFITETLGSGQPSKHAAADDGILLSQAAAAVDGAHAPHLGSMGTSYSIRSPMPLAASILANRNGTTSSSGPTTLHVSAE
ncbi:MAG: hypothetical protein FRX49_10341 [Trebouxia sp. A1-2]|nr:MAG: hypothetical protein FRX49_10341 [Trebouxia sp. A1-2]